MKYIHLTLTLTFTLLLFSFQLVPLHGVLNQHTDREALLSFKSQIIDPKKSLSDWTSDSNSSHCTWYGVSCSKVGSRVQSLHLSGLALSGILSSHLSNLSYLHSLDLSNNTFHGHIPSHLTRLSLLTDISLALNNLTGSLPPQLTRLRRLQILDLSVNNLTGKLPPQLGNLSSLADLSLARNYFSGEIPLELANLRNLSNLQLSDNNLSGELPSSIFNLSSLRFLSLTNNHLSGKLPENIGHSLPNLKSFFLADNGFGGEIPASISNASRLEILDLSGNQFQGWVPLFNNLNKLTKLNLGSNRLSSTTRLNSQLFESLENSTRLQILMLYSNRLAGELPSSVANLSTNIQHFCVAQNSLTGRIPMGMGKFQNLSSLSLEMNDFTGEIPVEIGALNKLEQLVLYQNRLSGEIPDILGNFTQLYNLQLWYNRFTGRIPASVGQCKQLYVLDLSMNRLNGTIPEEIFELSGLNTLNFTGNALAGPLPSEVSSLKMIEYMGISDNQLSGFIPEAIGDCSGLQYLGMARNNISGSIPTRLGDLGSLETLDLSSNVLSGQIPEKLEKLQYMVNLNLSFNHLEGQVPTNGVFNNLNKVDLQGNTKLCSLNHTVAHEWGILLCVIPTKRKRSFLIPIALAIVGAIALLVSLLVLFWVVMSRRNKKKITTTSSPAPLKGAPETISYGAIKLATNNFAAENLIGKGGFGYVYKGVFNISSTGEASTLAVKVLDLKQSKASKSFNAECEALRIVRHRNLVKVITSCSSIDHKGNEFKALVMQFMPSGDLNTWLYPIDEEEGTGSSLSLMQRLNIAIDVASALEYLHHGCDPAVVHCDLKPSNVLLDENMVGHVGDFGLARLLSQNPSQNYESSTLGLKGSIGYIAPEYGAGGKASTHGDVYNFGILLLEMFIARRPTDEMFKDGLSLSKLASSIMDDINQVMKVADPTLFKDYEYFTRSSSSTGCFGSDDDRVFNHNNNNKNGKESLVGKAERCIGGVIGVGLCCAAQEAKDRLNMREASTKLQAIRDSMLAL